MVLEQSFNLSDHPLSTRLQGELAVGPDVLTLGELEVSVLLFLRKVEAVSAWAEPGLL